MTKNILLADDEEETLALVSRTLGRDERYQVFLAKNG